MIELRTTAEGVLLPVKAQAGARRDEILGERAGRLRVAVVQVAEKGKANAAIEALIAESLGVGVRSVSVTGGLTSPLKTVLIRGATAEIIMAWLARVT